jgi:phenylalanyl-tRNA synthetase beta chain
MKITLNWLRQYVDFSWSPEELSERLTMLGLEVEAMQKIGGEFDGIVVAQVITRDKHPNADKLSLCRVNDGLGERQIVCGAQNFKAGDKVPLVLPGASLPLKAGESTPFTIKVGKIRGVESQGMMCSPQELGLPDQVDGLLLLREDAKIGQPFAEYLGRAGSDVVYDLEITPNRPDLNGVIGIAREIAAITGNPLRIPLAGDPDSGASGEISRMVAVRVEEPELCPRYTARIVRGVKVGPSPAWLRSSLEKVGVRSINNVVDVSNYVMLECGQPLHAFDYHLIGKATDGKPTIVIRRAGAGEKFVALDGQERTLTDGMLLIADADRGIALAGIMGGQNTEIADHTRDVLIESAYFEPTNIRRTARHLGLRSESSYRFERGADIGIAEWASRRCAQLILETAGGELVIGVAEVFSRPPRPHTIALRHAKVSELLGVAIPPAEQIRFLESLGLARAETPAANRVPFVESDIDTTTLLKKAVVAVGKDAAISFNVPSWRVDLKSEVDLIEEVTRLFGLENVPSTPPRGAIGSNPFDSVYDQLTEARHLLTALGLSEATGQTLLSEASARLAAVPESLVLLANPLSSDMNVLRPSLLPGLLDSLRHNLSRKNEEVALLEIGRVFAKSWDPAQARPGEASAGSPFDGIMEERRLAIAITGRRNTPFWSGDNREARYDFFDLKGMLEEFLDQFGLRGISYTPRATSTGLFLESATVTLGGKFSLGEFGQLLPALGRRYDLRDPVFLAELNVDRLLARRNPGKGFKPLANFPAIRRDVAMLVAETVTHEAVMNVVRKAKPANLENVEIFDVFRGKNIPTGQKSVAYAFTYRHPEHTLTDGEVNAAQEKLVEQFKESLQATVRDS